MIRALTGRKPKVSSGWRCRRRRRYDAKDWQEFLRLCDYEKIVTELEKGRYYIGIDPNCGEFGQLYWLTLGGLGVPTLSGGIKRIVVATTYENFKFKVDMMTDERLSELTIIEIGQERRDASNITANNSGDIVYFVRSGRIYDNELRGSGQNGCSWSFMLNPNTSNAYYLYFYRNGISLSSNSYDRSNGFPLRCLAS